MKFPSRIGGSITQQVGFFECDHLRLATWIQEGLNPGWSILKPGWSSVDEVLGDLCATSILSRYACVGVDGWALVMTNGPTGTDVGVLPSYGARELHCRCIRAVRVDDDDAGYPARILEVYGPGGEPPRSLERSIAVANDGGRWIFETSGQVFPFENEEAYKEKSKSSRLTGEMLHSYLLELGVPADSEPEWRSGVLVQRT